MILVSLLLYIYITFYSCFVYVMGIMTIHIYVVVPICLYVEKDLADQVVFLHAADPKCEFTSVIN